MISKANIPTRRQMLDALSAEPEFDVVVIGGGATGLGGSTGAARLTAAVPDSSAFLTP